MMDGIHLRSLDQWSSNAGRQLLTTETISFETLVPSFPTGLEEVGRSHEGVVTERSSDGDKVWLAVRGNERVDLVGEVWQGLLLVNGRAKLIGSEQAWPAISLGDGHLLAKLIQRLECSRQVDLRRL